MEGHPQSSPEPLPMFEQCTVRRIALLALVPVAMLSGCATLTGEPTQVINVQTLDARGHAVEGMRCRVSNGSEEYFGSSPMFALSVRRSSSDLEVQCQRGALSARATAVSRGNTTTALLKTILPGGGAATVIDHLTGYRYAYPVDLQLRVGQHLVFDAGDDVIGRPSKGVLADSSR